MPWNNKDLFVGKGGRRPKQRELPKEVTLTIDDECYGILPSDFDNYIQQSTPEQEKEYLIQVLNIDLEEDEHE